ncbi:unnamed protein product [Lampetra planeri]
MVASSNVRGIVIYSMRDRAGSDGRDVRQIATRNQRERKRGAMTYVMSLGEEGAPVRMRGYQRPLRRQGVARCEKPESPTLRSVHRAEVSANRGRAVGYLNPTWRGAGEHVAYCWFNSRRRNPRARRTRLLATLAG